MQVVQQGVKTKVAKGWTHLTRMMREPKEEEENSKGKGANGTVVAHQLQFRKAHVRAQSLVLKFSEIHLKTPTEVLTGAIP